MPVSAAECRYSLRRPLRSGGFSSIVTNGRIFLISRTDRQHDWRRAPAEATPSALAAASDEALVEQLRALSEPAWAEVYARHAQQVYAYIYYRLGDQHTAEDLAADVFVKALAGINRYSYRGTPLLAWLYRIAHNVTVDYRKAAARRARHNVAEMPEQIEERTNAIQAFDDASDMMSAIRTLTDEQQQVVILRFYAGMSNAEVSGVIGKPEGAVKALQSRALRSLRRALTGAHTMRAAHA